MVEAPHSTHLRKEETELILTSRICLEAWVAKQELFLIWEAWGEQTFSLRFLVRWEELRDKDLKEEDKADFRFRTFINNNNL